MKHAAFEIVIDPQSGSTFTEQIRQQLIWLITSGDLKSGQSLPSVRRLAEDLSINIHTARSAYLKLEEDGFVQVRHGRKAIILPYHAQQLAGIASQEHSHTIGVILPSMANPFYHALIQGVDEIARQNRSMIFICNSNDNQDQAFQSLAQLAAKHVDGILLASHSLPGRDWHLPRVEGSKPPALPIVTVDWPEAGGYSILFDYEKAGYTATRQLLEHGHRRIGLITSERKLPNVEPVKRGYVRAMQCNQPGSNRNRVGLSRLKDSCCRPVLLAGKRCSPFAPHPPLSLPSQIPSPWVSRRRPKQQE